MRPLIFIRENYSKLGNVKLYNMNNLDKINGKKRIKIEVDFINEYLEGILIFELQFFGSQFFGPQRKIKVG